MREIIPILPPHVHANRASTLSSARGLYANAAAAVTRRGSRSEHVAATTISGSSSLSHTELFTPHDARWSPSQRM